MFKFAGYTMFAAVVVATAVGLVVGTIAEAAAAPFRGTSH